MASRLELEELLDKDIEQAELAFLEQSVEDDDDLYEEGTGSENSREFDEELELAQEIIISTGCSSVDEEVEEFLRCGCGCKTRSCLQMLSAKDISSYRLSVSELERSELDLIVLAQLHAQMNAGELLTNTRGLGPMYVKWLHFDIVSREGLFVGKCSCSYTG